MPKKEIEKDESEENVKKDSKKGTNKKKTTTKKVVEKKDDKKLVEEASIKEEVKITKEEPVKAKFLQRFVAYVLDVFIVSIVASLITFPFVDNKSLDKLSDETIEVLDKYSKSEISLETYTTEMMSLSYQTAKANGLVSIITIFMEVLYFVVFQIYNNGQTIAKKLLNIQVVSTDGKLTMNQMIFRTLIINSILLELISFGLMLFASKYVYFYGVAVFETIQYLILIISVFMVINGKNGQGLHDKIAHTRVIKL